MLLTACADFHCAPSRVRRGKTHRSWGSNAAQALTTSTGVKTLVASTARSVEGCGGNVCSLLLYKWLDVSMNGKEARMWTSAATLNRWMKNSHLPRMVVLYTHATSRANDSSLQLSLHQKQHNRMD
jgi:hypothetical protein